MRKQIRCVLLGLLLSQTVTIIRSSAEEGSASIGPSSAAFDGRAVQYTSYFLNAHRIQHHRYELHLKQTAKVRSMTTVVSGRFRGDAALVDSPSASRRDADSAVRRDELAEGDLRQAYVDWLGETFSVRLGRQLVDWIDSLTPYASDVISPMDFRQGGFGAPDQVLIPMDALMVGVKIPGGTLESMAVMNPKPHRFPIGPNGYGYYEALVAKFPARTLTVDDGGIGRSPKDVEGGARYLAYVGGLDLALLAWSGHERTPILKVRSQTATEATVERTYSHLSTFGGSLTAAEDAFVLRALVFHEPRRRIQSFNPRINNPRDDFQPVGNRTRYGLGLDATWSKHFKFYSETWAAQTRAIDSSSDIDPTIDHVRTDYTFSLRATNESLDNIQLNVESAISSPHHSSIFSPSIAWTATDTKIALGWRMISSDNPAAPYEPIKDTDQAWTSLEYYF